MIEELNNYLMLPEEIEGIGKVYPIKLREWDKFCKIGGMIFSNGIQNIKNLYKFEGDYSLDFYVGKGTPAFVFKKTYDNLMSNINILNTIEKNIIENNIKELKKSIKLDFTIEDVEELFGLVLREKVKYEYVETEENVEYLFKIEDSNCSINKYNFEELRKVVMKQNLMYEPLTSPDELTNMILQQSVEKMINKNKGKGRSFENIVAMVSLEKGLKDEEVLDYTYYRIMKDYYMIERKHKNIYNAIFMSQGAKKCKIESFDEDIDMYYNPYDHIFGDEISEEEVNNSLGEMNKNKINS